MNIPRDHSRDAVPNFRAWNLDSNAHATYLGINSGHKRYKVIWTHDPERFHIITGKELETIGRFMS